MKVYHVQGEAPLHNDRAETWYYDFFGHFYAQNLDFLGGVGQNLGPFLQSCEMLQILQIYLCKGSPYDT